MRKSLFTLIIALFAMISNAQTELKVNPITILFGSVDISAEFGLTETIGLDIAPTLSFSSRDILDEKYDGFRYGAVVNPRYYFSPNRGMDKFYVGAYLKFLHGSYKLGDQVGWTQTRLAVGPNVGYKIVADSGFLFDIGFGVGRAIVNKNEVELQGLEGFDFGFNIDAIGKLAIGWRF